MMQFESQLGLKYNFGDQQCYMWVCMTHMQEVALINLYHRDSLRCSLISRWGKVTQDMKAGQRLHDQNYKGWHLTLN